MIHSEDTMAVGAGPIRARLAKRLDTLRSNAIEAAVAKGADRARAESAMEEIESDRPLLDWLHNGGFEKLLKLLLELLKIAI